MTDLERKALMGDKEAQRECTEKGIVLPCPVCYKFSHKQNDGIHEKSRNAPDSCADYHTTWKIRCEWCGHESHKYTTEFYFGRESGNIKIIGNDGCKKALSEWNTRPGPPIGRCKDCKSYINDKCAISGICKDENGFCESFEEREKNADVW